MKRNLTLVMAVVGALSLAASAGTISGKVSGVNGESVVYLEGIPGKTFPAPTERPVIDQKRIMFRPHITVVQQGTTCGLFEQRPGCAQRVLVRDQREQEAGTQPRYMAPGSNPQLQV